MTTHGYIDLLLKKYRNAPGFPFPDWTTDPVSFYALMNLWDEIFKTAAGTLAAGYAAGSETRMELDSLIYDLVNPAEGKRIAIHPEPEGGTFHLFSKTTDEGAVHRSELGFATDIQPDRLVAAFEIIRAYVRADLPDAAATEALDDRLVAEHKSVFGFPDFDPFAGPTPDDDDPSPFD